MSPISPTRFETGTPRLFAGLRRRHEFTAAAEGIVEQWREFTSNQKIPGRIGSSFYGVMCGSDATGIEYMCGVEVKSFADVPEGVGRIKAPPQQYAVFVHHGPVSTVGLTWLGILAWLESGDYESAHLPDFEIYGPDTQPQDTVGHIEVWVGVVPRSGERDKG